MGRILDSSSVSGIYACECGKLEAHVKGTEKAPCSKCGATDSWTLMVGTGELQKALNSLYSYICAKNLAEEVASRFEKR